MTRVRSRPHAPRLQTSRLPTSFVAAVLLSAAAHAAVVLVATSREPVGVASTAAAVTMRVRLAPSAVPTAMADAPRSIPVMASGRPAKPGRPATPRDAAVVSAPVVDATPVADATADGTVVDRRPRPLTYPVISLPPDDDPRRVGLVRLMLIVSSEGRVVKTVVTGATLSQDYVDRITASFEAVRFEPATVHGLPRASWYEVVVDLAFDPEARSSV